MSDSSNNKRGSRGNKNTSYNKRGARGNKASNKSRSNKNTKDDNKNENKKTNKKSQRGSNRGRGGKYKNNSNKPHFQVKKDSISLEKKKITIVNSLTGKEESRNALDKYYSIKSEFLFFLPSDNDINNINTLQSLQILNSDCIFLLNLSFHEFWSTVIFNISFKQFLDSFLQYWKSNNNIQSNVGNKKVKDELYYLNNGNKKLNDNSLLPEIRERRLLFLNMWKIIYRLSHPNESSIDWISNEYYSSIIQNIFSFSSLIDICFHYSCYNSKLVEKLMNYLFDIQPNYYYDIKVNFNQIESTLQQFISNIHSALLLYKKETSTTTTKNINNIKDSLFDSVEYLYNISTYLTVFINSTPNEVSLEILNNHFGFINYIIVLYEVVIPEIINYNNNLSDNHDDQDNREQQLLEKLQIAKNGFYEIFSHIINVCFVTPLTKNQKFENYDTTKYVYDFIQVISKLAELSDLFIKRYDYSSFQFPTNDDKILFILVDHLNLQQVLLSLTNFFQFVTDEDIAMVLKIIHPFLPKDSQKANSISFKAIHLNSNTNYDHSSSQRNDNNNNNNSLSPERLEKIKLIKGIFDHLGEGFINECLELYNDDNARVCDRLLSETLAEPLLELDRSMPLKTTNFNHINQQSHDNTETSSIISPPDEFSSVHIGKKNQNYEKNIEELKDFNKRYNFTNTYDDEYDDSMDQYLGFSVDDETEDEKVSLTESQKQKKTKK